MVSVVLLKTGGGSIMHPDLQWAVERNTRTSAERGEPVPPANDWPLRGESVPSLEGAAPNAFETLAAIGTKHNTPSPALPLTPKMKAALARAGQERARRIYIYSPSSAGSSAATLRGLQRRQLGVLEYQGRVLDAIRLNDSGLREATRLAGGK
jgi:hypothetical protein